MNEQPTSGEDSRPELLVELRHERATMPRVGRTLDAAYDLACVAGFGSGRISESSSERDWQYIFQMGVVASLCRDLVLPRGTESQLLTRRG
jgi:hypothetical protein